MWVVFTCRGDCSLQISARSEVRCLSYGMCLSYGIAYSIGYILYLKIRFFGHKYRNMQIQKLLGHMDLEAHLAHQFH